MESILLGLLVALLVGTACMLFWSLVYIDYNSTTPKAFTHISITLFIVSWVGSSLMIIDADNTLNKAWSQQYISQKQLIEESLNNEKLNGLERVELVKQANDLNSELIKKQFKCVKWYNFTMDDKVLELEPVSLK